MLERIRVGRIPRPADCFQDRQVAERMRAAAGAGETVALTQVLAGMGGVGKTQLAAAYARDAWKTGVEVLVWVNARSRDGIISAYAETARELGLVPAGHEDARKAAEKFLVWAETTTDRRWLVVLDDVQRPADVNGLWPPAGTSAAGGRVVVTTRLREAALARADHHFLEIGIYTPQEADSYLRARLEERADAADRRALAGGLGHLPLALAQAAAYIANMEITPGDYRNLLATELLKDVVPEEGHLTDDHQQIVTATWNLSIDQADAAHPAGLAKPVLQLASVLDSAGIPHTVLSSPPALDHLTSHQPIRAQAVDAAMVGKALRTLHRYSLIDHDRSAIHHEVRVHQLVQRATRENLAAQPDLGPELFAALADTAADALLHVWPEAKPEFEELSRILRANTAALGQAAGTALWNSADGLPTVLIHAADSLYQAGQFTTAIPVFTDLHATALRHLGPDHPDVLIVRNYLAVCRGLAGDVAGAIVAFHELFADAMRVLDPGSDPDLIVAITGNLVYWLGAAGDSAGAAAALEKLLPAVTRAFGPDDHLILIQRSLLARWRGEAGDAAAAVTATEEVLADMERVLGPDHRDTLIAGGNLARWRGEVGDPTGAATFEALLADMERVLGPDHLETLVARSSVAFWRGQTGDAPGAATSFAELLVDAERVLGPGHPRTNSIRSSLAYWRNQMGGQE
ncbi:hypothetical protein ACRB68_01080 [Actinomadura sp. RB68]|uniref:Tetratricopeptide repeat protein n=1 Tax=Actinomadura macrotermitis TaxID=2585200 RepID=A0A7K0BLQ0_9ACTN|nr:hypothetical protein [Actinomadura macrotermitis]